MNKAGAKQVIFQCVLWVMASVLTSSGLQAQLILRQGDAAEYRFHFSAPPTTVRGPVEFISYGGSATFSAAFDSIDVSLYDGDQLLGSRRGLGAFDYVSFFTSPSAPSFAPIIVPIAFDSVLDGTIDGRLLFTPHFSTHPLQSVEQGFVELDLQISSGVFSQNGGFFFSSSPIVTGAFVRSAVPVPEASTYGWAASVMLLGVITLSKRLRCFPRSS